MCPPSPVAQFPVAGSLDLTVLYWKIQMRPDWPAVLLLLVPLAACSPDGGGEQRPRSERERDSMLGASQLPGARGVRGALGASDSADARNARLDSLANQP
jgi:hypothetical protein